MMLYTFHSYYIYTLILLFNSVFHVISLLMMSVVIYIARLKHLLKYLLKGTSVEISWIHMGVSKNNGTPKSSIVIGVFPYFHHPFWGVSPYFWKHPRTSVTRGLDRLVVQHAPSIPKRTTMSGRHCHPNDWMP